MPSFDVYQTCFTSYAEGSMPGCITLSHKDVLREGCQLTW